MTFAAVPSLVAHGGGAFASVVAAAAAPAYDPANAPMATKRGITLGMSMTELQGGSDVRANTTVARPLCNGAPAPGDAWALIGAKCVCAEGSAPRAGHTTAAHCRPSAISLAPAGPTAQVVHVGAQLGRIPDAGADGRGPRLLPRAAVAAGRHAQRGSAVRAAEGQVRRQVERIV